MKKNSITLLLLVFIIGCQNQPENLVEKHYFIFGTIVNVLIWHENDEVVAQALDAVEARLNGMHRQWHAWKAGRLNEINTALRAGDTLLLTDEEVAFIQTTQQLSRESLDNFNPAIGELIDLWGFHTDVYPILQPPPSDDAIQLFLQNLPTMADIVIVNNQISSANKSIWLDYGGGNAGGFRFLMCHPVPIVVCLPGFRWVFSVLYCGQLSQQQGRQLPAQFLGWLRQQALVEIGLLPADV